MTPNLPVVPFSVPDTIRLIPAAYIDEPALAPLADNDDELSVLEELEGLTSARRTPRLPVPGGLDPDELLTAAHGYGWTYINAAFCYTRMGGSRFNSEDRGAWYAAFGKHALKTAQTEVAWHLTRELDATGIYDNITAYRELIAGFSTSCHDLRTKPESPALDPDPAKGYPQGQALAQSILAAGGNGVLYPSARAPGGNCVAALRPAIVQNVRQGRGWVFTWSGSRTPDIAERT